MPADEITVGRILHFVPGEGRARGECRAAIVVNHFGESVPNAHVNLVVFLDGRNDNEDFALTAWETSVIASHAVKVERSWHWPRECSGLVLAAPAEVIEGQRYAHNHAVGFVDPHNCRACLEKHIQPEVDEASAAGV